MENAKTIGEVVDMAISKATAELQAARSALAAELPMAGNLNPLGESRKHLAEAVDAILMAAGSFGGEDSKRELLKLALTEHGIEIK